MSLVTSHCAHSTQHTAHSMHVLSRARGSRKRRGRRSDRDCEVCQYCVSSVPRVEAVVVPIDQPAAGRTGAQQKHTVTMPGSSWGALLAILARGPPGVDVDQRPRVAPFLSCPFRRAARTQCGRSAVVRWDRCSAEDRTGRSIRVVWLKERASGKKGRVPRRTVCVAQQALGGLAHPWLERSVRAALVLRTGNPERMRQTTMWLGCRGTGSVLGACAQAWPSIPHSTPAGRCWPVAAAPVLLGLHPGLHTRPSFPLCARCWLL